MAHKYSFAKAAVGAVLIGLSAFSQPAVASGDALIEGARMCTQYFPEQERTYGIPNHLLAAISSAESGRWHDGLGMPLPWPWTINVEGRGYYFPTKETAIAQTQLLMRQGHQSIDVGCMQVNLMHHPDAFASLNDAFDPKHNVEYGAKFLRSNYDQLGDWVKATAAYHSRTPVYGQQYLAIIEKSWDRIVAKVQEAREHQGMAPIASDKLAFKNANLSRDARFNRGQLASASPASSNTMHSISSTHGVRVISIKNEPVNKADVLVIHPAQDASPIRVADAVPVYNENGGITAGETGPHRIIVGQYQPATAAPTMAPAQAAASTNFVFAN